MKKGLLLGAGFSFDLGMPLVTGLTLEEVYDLVEKYRKNTDLIS